MNRPSSAASSADESAEPACPLGPEDDLRAWREYAFFRDELRHEDNMLNARVSWLIGSQAFLLGGFAALVNSGAGATSPQLASLKACLLVGLPLAGTLSVAASYASILAAVIHIHGVRRLTLRKRVRGMPALHEWHASVRRLGLVGPLVTPLIFFAFWILILLKMGGA